MPDTRDTQQQQSHRWDNQYDVNNPYDVAHPGDTTETPVDDKQYVQDHATAPILMNYDGGNQETNNALSDRFQNEQEDKDLNQTTMRENHGLGVGMGGTRMGYLDDQTADPDQISTKPKLDYENTHIDSEKSWQGDSHGEHFPDYMHRDWNTHTQPDSTLRDSLQDRERMAHRIANNIVAEYLLQHKPQTVKLGEDRLKVSYWNLNELMQFTSALSTKYEPGCSTSLKRSMKGHNRYTFHVKCGEKWSDPAGHTVKVKFIKRGNRVDPLKCEVKVSCSCPFWVYYGADWKAQKDKYIDKKQGPGTKPEVHALDNMICKHVAACIDEIKGLRVDE